ncbi:MAG: hypothetical protein HYZ17_07710 [Betaproteobacteria bacterium]|nr:hypothetical protein [Betaproteobacteria bacterium]
MTKGLPNSERALVEEKKILEYLLNPAHPDGGPKARFFQARGFDAARWFEMRDALVAQGRDNPVVKVTRHQWGTRYQVDCRCPTPDRVNPCIRSIWELAHAAACPRLLTAYPLDR